MNNQENQAVEIDVFAMLKTLWKRKFSIVLVALVFAIAAFGYSAFLAKKEYQRPAGSTWSVVKTKTTMP